MVCCAPAYVLPCAAAFAEGMSLADKAGLKQDDLLDVLGLGAMANPMFGELTGTGTADTAASRVGCLCLKEMAFSNATSSIKCRHIRCWWHCRGANCMLDIPCVGVLMMYVCGVWCCSSEGPQLHES